MSESQQEDITADEHLLESALSTAFAPISVNKVSAKAPEQTSSTTATTSAPEAPVPEQGSQNPISKEEEEKWRSEYEEQVQKWKEESATARAKAEEERARWESIRVAEKASSSSQSISASTSGWEKVEDDPIPGPPNPHFQRKQYPSSPSPADVRDQVAGEPSYSRAVASTETQTSRPQSPPTTSQAQHSRRSSSHQWEEEVRSLESSFPSLSYPSQSDNASAKSSPGVIKTDKSEKQTSQEKDGKAKQTENPTISESIASGAVAAKEGSPPSATLSVFDTRLSTRTRVLALVSSLAINLLLPFVNGVMLGFGEIFARTFAIKMGWTAAVAPGGAATAVGLRSKATKKEERKRD